MVARVSAPRRKPQRKSRPQSRNDDRTPQVGRRPSSPAMLFAIAAMWIVVGVIALVVLSASWKLIPGVVFIGVGLLYLRGALATVARRGER